MLGELRTKLLNFAGTRFEDMTDSERPPREEEDPPEEDPPKEETVLEPSSGPQEIHPTGGRRVTGETTIAGDDPDQVPDQDSQLLTGDGKRPRVEKETTRQTNRRTWSEK